VLQPTVLVSALTAFKLNPRKHFDAKAMQELTDSVKAQGVVQAIVVRPNGKPGTYEIVAGERRWRAAKAAGLAEIPATIRELTDAQALELAVIENNQRENLHPLEEAEGYEALLKQKHANLSKYTVEDLMAKIGRSKSYVYQRLKLLDLCEEARKAYYAGKLDYSKAVLIARIAGVELQRKALKEISEGHYAGAEPMSFRSGAAARAKQLHARARARAVPDQGCEPRGGRGLVRQVPEAHRQHARAFRGCEEWRRMH
jgi:ParB/RepB/Spo0J family partition protein